MTLEPPDQENIANISSIPAQQYWCEPYSSVRYPNTFQIMDVPERTKVLFHGGNTVEHTAGCILLAQHYGKLKANRGILNSGETFRQFMNLVRDYPRLHLTIREVF